eukprot:1720730-Ditylum_brightwellii.AAC.1
MNCYGALKQHVLENNEFVRKRKKRQQDKYADVTLPWPDVKVASRLCIGGPCRYSLKDGCTLSNNWLIQHVVPGIVDAFECEVVLVLALPFIWAVFDEERLSAVSPLIARQ